MRRAEWLLACVLLVACGRGDEHMDARGEPLGAEGAHEHGVARVDIAIDGAQAIVAFRGPASGVYGFEHAARTPGEVEQRDAGLEALRERIPEMVRFAAALGCTFRPIGVGHLDEVGEPVTQTPDTAQPDTLHAHEHADEQTAQQQATGARDTAHVHAADDGHREVVAEFEVTCASPLSGSRVTLAVTDFYPAFERVDLRVVAEERQFGARVPGSGGGTRL
jgi:hypothetical protein